MTQTEQIYVFLSPEVQQVLLDHETDIEELLRRADSVATVATGSDPAADSTGKKEPAIILLASAAVIAAATPLLREVIQALAGRHTVLTERRLVAVLDGDGKVVRGSNGDPVLHWEEIERDRKEPVVQTTQIKGFGVQVSFGAK